MKLGSIIYAVTLVASLFSNSAYAEISGSGDVRMQGGVARANVHLYTDGLITFTTQASSAENYKGVKANVFVVAVDSQGRSLYVSPVINIPTACGRRDPSCHHDVTGGGEARMAPELAAIITRLDVYISGRTTDNWRHIWDTIHSGIEETCNAANDLPIPVKLKCGKQL